MTFFRHFVERSDFEILVVTPSLHVGDHILPYEPVQIRLPLWWERVCRTRLRPYLYPVQALAGQWFLDRHAVERIREFRPEAVFSVAGNWDWTALAGLKMARKFKIPMIASFNDWYDYGSFPADERFRPLIERRFRRFYREADLALCTCEGMREALGDHPNVHILYPTGAPVGNNPEFYEPHRTSDGEPLRVLFAGSLGDWYGPMMESIVVECERAGDPVEFKIFGSLETWSDEFGKRAKETGVFRGRVDFDNLRREAETADLLFLPMGFGKECAQVERTSFKTKFLDYLSFRRPILVWGPEYCSAVRVAREFDSAECVTDPSPEACREALSRLAANSARRKTLILNANTMYYDRFHPDRIHESLVERIGLLIESARSVPFTAVH